jgi:Ni/Co efflux regulator RcnB
MKRTILTIAAVALVAVPVVQAQQAPDTLSIAADHGSVKFGGSITLSGKLTGANVDGRNVRVQADEFPVDSFSNAGNATTNATGDWSLVVKPTANTRYRARVGNMESANLDVTVMPKVSLRLSDRTPARGQRVTFSGRVCPEHDTVAIALQRRSSTGWKTIASPVLADIPNVTCSSYSVVKRVRRNGRFRARFLGDADHAVSNSRVKRARAH